MEYKRGRYSWLLRPFLMIFDVFVINILAFFFINLNQNNLYFFSSNALNNKYILFLVYSTLFWVLISFVLKFYHVYRYSSALNIFVLLLKQFFVYSLVTFAFIGIFRSVNIQAYVTLNYVLYCFLAVGAVKLLSFYTLQTYRSYLKGNIRKVVVIGNGNSAQELIKMFSLRKELGYNVQAVFTDANNSEKSGTIEDSFVFLKEEKKIDEIYCSIDELDKNQVNDYVKYANINHCNIKFITNTNELYSKRFKTNFYNYLPVLSIQQVPLNEDLNAFVKRVFDIIFSLLIIVFVLSWLYLILFILIKLESKGPVIFKHKRNGINYKEFECYKFRSLTVTKEEKGTYVKQDDYRLTRIGKFLRKTSIDELPQFINVLKGDMSVVGPRPHMPSYTQEYSKIIDKYDFIFRHNVRPGITGLAQVKGYRGEVKLNIHIINRIKYDIYYIENWSLLLDIKIIVLTVLNFFKGQDTAY